MNTNFSKNISIGIPLQIKTYRNAVIEIVLLVVICSLYGWFVVLPKRAVLATQEQELAVVKKQEADVAEKVKTMNLLIKKLKDNSEKVKYLDQAIPLEGKVIYLRFLLENLAQSVGLSIGEISINSKSDSVAAGDKVLLANPFGASRTLQKMTGSVYVIGSLSQLEAFLQKIENNGRIIDITDLSIDSAPEGLLNMKLIINAYYFAQ